MAKAPDNARLIPASVDDLPSPDTIRWHTHLKARIVACLRDKPHTTHAHFERVLELVERVRPARPGLTHMNHQIDYEDLKSRCPAGVEPGYDGMVLEV